MALYFVDGRFGPVLKPTHKPRSSYVVGMHCDENSKKISQEIERIKYIRIVTFAVSDMVESKSIATTSGFLTAIEKAEDRIN